MVPGAIQSKNPWRSHFFWTNQEAYTLGKNPQLALDDPALASEQGYVNCNGGPHVLNGGCT